jgi:uncharacterized membrane-anchored protein YitT (DUF2179 family)
MSAKVFKYIQSYLIIGFGLLLYALGVTAFLIPAEIAAGGVTGVSMVVYYATGIPTGYTFFAINIFLVVIAVKVLGTSFGVKTIISMVIMSVLLNVLQGIITEPIVNDTFLSAVLGGIFAGVGIGIVFNQGGSTGGTDIIAMIINKYRNITPGRVIMYCDVIIVASSFIVIKSVEKLVYGYVVMGVVSYAIDAFLTGAKQSVQMFIFSKKYKQIADYINHDANRGLTVLDGTGWYTKRDVKVIMTVIKKREAPQIFRRIKQIDADAFISQSSVMGVFGEGFDKLKY